MQMTNSIEIGNMQWIPNYALSFDGVDDGVNLFILSTNTITIEGRFKFDNISGDEEIIGNYGTGASDNHFEFYIKSDGTLRFGTDDGSNYYSVDTSTSYDDDIWHSFRIIYNDDTKNQNIYIDENLVADDNRGSGSVNLNQRAMNIARRTSNNDRYYNGYLDEFRIWDIETQSDLTQELTGNETGLIAYYKMNEGSGSTLTDSAGTNDGAINGATWQEVE